jgi:sialate O-acetylesterase
MVFINTIIMKLIQLRTLKTLVAILAFTLHCQGKVILPSILSSHMVLQQNTKVKFWGKGSPKEVIIIKPSWDTASYTITTDGNAKWSTYINTPAASGPFTIEIKGSNTILLEDILIGEVWLCSGQSNMEMSGNSLKLRESVLESPNATNNKIRFFYVPNSTSTFPQDNIDDARWVVCSPSEMIRFSAIGYFFGKELNKSLSYPIGLIGAYWGGTNAEAWSPNYLIENNNIIKKGLSLATPNPGRPHESSIVYNSMIYPLANFNIAGVIWYQGESNTNSYFAYEKLFRGMIDAWRTVWQKDFPFYFVQIAPYRYKFSNVGALLREKQNIVSKHPGTGLVVISDLVPDTLDIHPTKKIEVAIRLANLALFNTYQLRHLKPFSPEYSSHIIEKDKFKIFFSHAESGFVWDGEEIKGFEIAGEDRIFYPAEVKFEKNYLVVFNKLIAKPIAVRFGFHNTTVPNLFNKERLPVNLFRTDNWEVATDPIK